MTSTPCEICGSTNAWQTFVAHRPSGRFRCGNHRPADEQAASEPTGRFVKGRCRECGYRSDRCTCNDETEDEVRV